MQRAHNLENARDWHLRGDAGRTRERHEGGRQAICGRKRSDCKVLA